MSVAIVDLLELVEINIDESEDGGLLAGLIDLRVQSLVEGEAVMDVGQQVELGAAAEVGVEVLFEGLGDVAGFDAVGADLHGAIVADPEDGGKRTRGRGCLAAGGQIPRCAQDDKRYVQPGSRQGIRCRELLLSCACKRSSWRRPRS